MNKDKIRAYRKAYNVAQPHKYGGDGATIHPPEHHGNKWSDSALRLCDEILTELEGETPEPSSMSSDCCSCHLGHAPCAYCQAQSELEEATDDKQG